MRAEERRPVSVRRRSAIAEMGRVLKLLSVFRESAAIRPDRPDVTSPGAGGGWTGAGRDGKD